MGSMSAGDVTLGAIPIPEEKREPVETGVVGQTARSVFVHRRELSDYLKLR